MDKKAIIVTGLGFGDEGKGTTVDWLCRQFRAPIVVKSSGGAQCAHNVVDGTKHHTFAQFGSGTFAGARTHISQFFLLNPVSLVNEAVRLMDHVADPFGLLTVASTTPIITPWHVAMNRLREAERRKSDGAHGSCGQGIGETASDLVTDPTMVVRAYDLGNPGRLARKLSYWKEKKREEALLLTDQLPEQFDDPFLLDATLDVYRFVAEEVTIVSDVYVMDMYDESPLIFEGGQGALLDEWRGFHPHTTWSTTTDENAWSLLPAGHHETDVLSLGVTRSYMTRHGPGPMPTEGSYEATEKHNRTGTYQGAFRVGPLDIPMLRYGLSACRRVDGVVVTHMDRCADPMPVCARYENTRLRLGDKGDLRHQEALTAMANLAHPVYVDWDKKVFLDCLGEALDRPVVIKSWGPEAKDKVADPQGTW